jgi:citrate synthase
MATTVRDLMSAPAVTCESDATLSAAAATMADAGIGSVIVTGDGKIDGILTERDLLRAAASRVDLDTEPVTLWMTARPDVLGADEEVGAAWSSLTSHHYRHLPVVEGSTLIGIVSIRDLLALARLRPPDEPAAVAPAGLEGVIAAETSIGDVRGLEGFYHYRQYSAVELAERRGLEDVWWLLFDGELPDAAAGTAFRAEVADLRTLPPPVAALVSDLAGRAAPLDVLRTAVSALGSELRWRPTLDTDAATLRRQATQLCAVVPTILAAAWRAGQGLEPVPPRRDLGASANYLWMLLGETPDPVAARAVEQYQILTIDHGFNSSTFTARVITSTGADLAAAICGAVGALSGPLHGGAPSRALDMLDEIGTPGQADTWLRAAVERGDRLMGFGHRVYKTDDPRSLFLRALVLRVGGDMVEFATEVERAAVEVLAELKPGRRLYTNVEFYAGVLMESCGIPRPMFTPTFAAGRTIGWAAHVLEQAAHNRLIRPSAHYVGPPPPQPVPAS